MVAAATRRRDKSGKPPLGCRPRWYVDEQRMAELCEAVERYIDTGERVPVEWIDEMREIAERIAARKRADA